jgi:uncharacterized protein with HEPN domain
VSDDRLYLAHISEALARIETYIAGGRDEFMTSTLIQDAVLRNLQTLGEAVEDLPNSWKEAHPSMPWSSIVGFRNVVTHNYLYLDMERAWTWWRTTFQP